MNSENLMTNNKPKPISVVAAVILTALCSVGMPFATNTYVAIGLSAICSVFLVAVSRRKISTVAVLLFLIGAFATDAGMMVVAIILSMIVGTGVFARLIEKTRSHLLWFVPVAGFCVAAVVTKEIPLSFLSLGFALPALALAITFSKGEGRTTSICATSAAILGGVACVALVSLYQMTGSLDPKPLYQISLDLRASIAELLGDFQVQLADGQIVSLLSELDAQNIASTLVSLFPAFLIISCNAIAFFAQKILFMLTFRAGETEKLTPRVLALALSPFAGAVFILSFLISTLTANSLDNALVYTVCQNIFYIFIPGLAISGVMMKLAKISHERRGAWIILPFLILLFLDIGSAVLLAAGLGAYYSIANPLAALLRSDSDEN